MTGLLLIRHAETDMAGSFCGHSDPPVNERGRQQIEELVAGLTNSGIEAVYTSDLQRARSTAERIAQAFDLPWIAQSDLREINFGAWEGLSWSEIEIRDAAYARQWVIDYPSLPAPQGERFADLEDRVLQAISSLQARHEHGCAAVVTHGGVMRVVLERLCDKDSEEAWELTKLYCSSFLYSLNPSPLEVRS